MFFGHKRPGKEEFLYRRVSPTWFDPSNGLPPPPLAFHPQPDDANGLSLRRAKLISLQEAACSKTNPEKKYFVARLRTGDLPKEMEVEIDPKDATHVLIRNMNYSNRRDKRVGEWEVKMATELCKVLDPMTGEVVWEKA